MADNTSIEWCDASLSLWWGCTKVSDGCKSATLDLCVVENRTTTGVVGVAWLPMDMSLSVSAKNTTLQMCAVMPMSTESSLSSNLGDDLSRARLFTIRTASRMITAQKTLKWFLGTLSTFYIIERRNVGENCLEKAILSFSALAVAGSCFTNLIRWVVLGHSYRGTTHRKLKPKRSSLNSSAAGRWRGLSWYGVLTRVFGGWLPAFQNSNSAALCIKSVMGCGL